MSTQREQHFHKVLQQCATFLARWKGTTASLLELTRSHQTLTIVLDDHDCAGNLVLACIEPIRISAPAHWPGSHIVVSHTRLPDGQDAFIVTDADAGVEIVCGAVEVAENVRLRD